MIEGDLAHQPLKAGSSFSRGARLAQILVDHFDPATWPAQFHGALHQAVLEPRRLLVPRQLPRVSTGAHTPPPAALDGRPGLSRSAPAVLPLCRSSFRPSMALAVLNWRNASWLSRLITRRRWLSGRADQRAALGRVFMACSPL